MKDYGHQGSPIAADGNLEDELFILPEVRNLEAMVAAHLALAIGIVSRLRKFYARITIR